MVKKKQIKKNNFFDEFGKPGYGLAFLGISISLISFSISAVADFNSHENIVAPVKLATDYISIASKIDNVDIEAKSAIVYRIKNKEVIYAKNPDEVLPLASLTKIPAIFTASKMLGKDTDIPITETAVGREGDTGLSYGEHFSFEMLSNLSLITSSNDGIFAIAEKASQLLSPKEEVFQDAISTSTATTTEEYLIAPFVKKMNEEMHKIGLDNFTFHNASGLDIDEQVSGGYGTAREYAELIAKILDENPDIILQTREPSIEAKTQNGFVVYGKNTNELVASTPGTFFSKTGYTDLASGNLAIAVDTGFNDPVIVVVLGSTYKDRFADAYKLYRAVFQSN